MRSIRFAITCPAARAAAAPRRNSGGRRPRVPACMLGPRDGKGRREKDEIYFLRSGCCRKNAHIRLVASMLRLVGPTSHSGIGWPPGQVWPPPLIVYSTTLALSAQSVYSRRVASDAAADSTGVGEQRFLRAQFAVHSGMLGNGSGASHTLAPLYGVNRSPVPGRPKSQP